MGTVVDIRPIVRSEMQFRIKGTSPLIVHAWSDKAKRMMREKQAGKKTKTREARDPEAEVDAALYRTAEGEIGLPGMGFKNALVSAAHKDLGIDKTMVRKAVFLRTSDPEKVLPLIADGYETREDMVRVGMGTADLRYRPMFTHWACDVTLEIDADLLKPDDILTLVDRAGFGVGICEWRPEKDGEFGRFAVDRTHAILVRALADGE